MLSSGPWASQTTILAYPLGCVVVQTSAHSNLDDLYEVHRCETCLLLDFASVRFYSPVNSSMSFYSWQQWALESILFLKQEDLATSWALKLLIFLALYLGTWRVWKFSIIPALYPSEPKVLPYWTPRKLMIPCLMVVRC